MNIAKQKYEDGGNGVENVQNVIIGAIPAIMMLIVFIMGMFMDWAAILLVTVTILMPIVIELELNPLWFSILMCVNLQTSFLTPPFGSALFYFKGVAP